MLSFNVYTITLGTNSSRVVSGWQLWARMILFESPLLQNTIAVKLTITSLSRTKFPGRNEMKFSLCSSAIPYNKFAISSNIGVVLS